MPVGVKDTLRQGLEVQQWDDLRCHEGIKALMELAALSSVSEWCHEPSLVLDEWIIYMKFG